MIVDATIQGRLTVEDDDTVAKVIRRFCEPHLSANGNIPAVDTDDDYDEGPSPAAYEIAPVQEPPLEQPQQQQREADVEEEMVELYADRDDVEGLQSSSESELSESEDDEVDPPHFRE